MALTARGGSWRGAANAAAAVRPKLNTIAHVVSLDPAISESYGWEVRRSVAGRAERRKRKVFRIPDHDSESYSLVVPDKL